MTMSEMTLQRYNHAENAPSLFKKKSRAHARIIYMIYEKIFIRRARDATN